MPLHRLPLHLAVRRGSQPCVKLLLRHGADVRARVQGKTPLDLALINKRERIAELLRAAEAADGGNAAPQGAPQGGGSQQRPAA